MSVHPIPAAVLLAGAGGKGDDVESASAMDAHPVSGAAILEHIHRIKDKGWQRTCLTIMKRHGPQGALTAIRDK